MPRIGLALSGGGFRATLFHLGVVRYLKDVGRLQHVTDIASVSGGSVLAAHLVLNWDLYNGDDEAFSQAAAQIVKFVQYDVRNRIVRRLPMQIPIRFMAKLTRQQGRNLTPNAILEHYYRKFLYGDRCLYELPEQPSLHILTTNVSNGGLSVFNRQGLFIQQRDVGNKNSFRHIPGEMACIPRVVGASSAFPGFFPPVEITASDLGVREGQFPTEWFTDGGVYDNLSIRAFSWLKHQDIEFDRVLVSDAGKPFQVLNDASLSMFGQSVRATDILWDRVWQLERENFGKQEGFLFLPITKTVDRSDDPTAQHPVVQAEVQSVRTDLDRFSPIEINSLVRHGYEVARQIIGPRNGPDSEAHTSTPPWAPLPDKVTSTSDESDTPSSEPSQATQLARRLRKSSRRRIWSSLFDPIDWPSYVYLVIAFVLFCYAPFKVYQLYQRSQVQATVIDAIATGDPDIRQVLDLIDADPTVDWKGEDVKERSTATETDYEGVQVVTHSRILDLRRWNPEAQLEARQGKVFVRDRFTLQLLDSYKGDRIVTIAMPLPDADVEFRQPNSEIRGTISRVMEPYIEYGEKRVLYEFEYDLSNVPLEEPVTIELELLVTVPKLVKRARFVTKMKTELVSVWMLFPTDRPYRNYNLVRYPADRSARAEVMNARYVIDHPFGSLIGWSVVNPEASVVYECRWTME